MSTQSIHKIIVRSSYHFIVISRGLTMKYPLKISHNNAELDLGHLWIQIEYSIWVLFKHRLSTQSINKIIVRSSYHFIVISRGLTMKYPLKISHNNAELDLGHLWIQIEYSIWVLFKHRLSTQSINKIRVRSSYHFIVI